MGFTGFTGLKSEFRPVSASWTPKREGKVKERCEYAEHSLVLGQTSIKAEVCVSIFAPDGGGVRMLNSSTEATSSASSPTTLDHSNHD